MGPSRIRFEVLIAFFVMTVATCALFPELAFQNKVFFSGDSQSAFSFSVVGSESLKQGEYPVWNPFLFGGMPSYASASYLPRIYPVSHLLHYLQKIFHLPGMIWLLSHIIMMGFGIYLLLRDRGVHYGAAMAAGVVMIWIPNFVAVAAHGHGSQACASAYLPYVLLLWDRIWRGKALLPHAAGLVLLLGCSMLRGHLQISYYTYVLLGLHLLFFVALGFINAAKKRSPDTSVLPKKWFSKMMGTNSYTNRVASAEAGWATGVLAVIVTLSIVASFVLYLPLSDYAQYSIRGGSDSGGAAYEYATSWSLHPLEMLTFVFPFALGFGKDLYYGFMPFTDYPNYLGILVFAFAIFGLIKVRTSAMRFLAFVALVTTLIAFGKYFPILYGPMFKFLPHFSKFRIPVMILIVQQVAIVAMFGYGLDAVLRVDAKVGKPFILKLLAGVFVLFVIAIFSQGFWSSEFAEGIAARIRSGQTPQEKFQIARVAGTMLSNDLIRLSAVLGLACMALFAYFRSRRIPTVALLVSLGLISVVDLYLVDRNIVHPERFRRQEAYRLIKDKSVREKFRESDPEMEFLNSATGPFRVFPMDAQLFASNRYMVFGISSVGGYHPAKLKWTDRFIREAFTPSISRGRFDLIDMMNVRYVITRSPIRVNAQLREVWRGNGFESQPRYIYENPTVTPRVHFVDKYRVVDSEAALNLLKQGTVDVKQEAILAVEPGIKPVSAVGAVGQIKESTFGRIVIEATTDDPCILVLSEVYYPAWKVKINGEPSEIIRTNYLLRGIALPAGEHEIVLYYDAERLRRGGVITASTLGSSVIVLIGYLLATIRNRRREDAHRRTDI